jgi:glycosyltransferase involved in cell wall biosynthesis
LDLREYLNIKPKEYLTQPKRLGYLGRLDLDKGLMEAVEAVRILVQERGFQDVVLIMAGSGPASAQLHIRVDELGLANHVKLVGPIYGSGKMKFWRESDILVFPSYHEGLPFTLLESLATGTPVVATDVGGIPDVIEDGQQGLLVQPRNPQMLADAIATLMCDPERLTYMSRACIARVAERYGIDRLVRDVSALYKDMLTR